MIGKERTDTYQKYKEFCESNEKTTVKEVVFYKTVYHLLIDSLTYNGPKNGVICVDLEGVILLFYFHDNGGVELKFATTEAIKRILEEIEKDKIDKLSDATEIFE